MSHDGKILDSHTLRFERLLPGPITLAWDFLTKPALVKTWLVADVALEPKVGGAITVRFAFGGEEGCDASFIRGTISAYEPPRLLAYSWVPHRTRPNGATDIIDEGEVRFELAESGDKVRLTMTHRRIPTAELAGYAAGWHAFLDTLEHRLSDKDQIAPGALHIHAHPDYAAAVAQVLQQGG